MMLHINFAAKHLGIAVILGAAAIMAKTDFSGISWFRDFDKASEVANQTNRPMIIEFWADWCDACKVMEDQVYNDPKIISAINDKLVPVRIHYDLQKDLVQKYNVPALPYLIFTTSTGTELLHHRGRLEAGELSALIKAFPAEVSEFNRLDRLLQQSKDDFEPLVAMGRELRAAAFLQASNRYYSKAIKRDAAKSDLLKRESILRDMGLNFLDLKQAKQAIEIFERCLKEFPQSINKPAILLNLANAYILAEQKSKARKSLMALIDGFPQSEASQKGQILLKSL